VPELIWTGFSSGIYLALSILALKNLYEMDG